MGKQRALSVRPNVVNLELSELNSLLDQGYKFVTAVPNHPSITGGSYNTSYGHFLVIIEKQDEATQ